MYRNGFPGQFKLLFCQVILFHAEKQKWRPKSLKSIDYSFESPYNPENTKPSSKKGPFPNFLRGMKIIPAYCCRVQFISSSRTSYFVFCIRSILQKFRNSTQGYDFYLRILEVTRVTRILMKPNSKEEYRWESWPISSGMRSFLIIALGWCWNRKMIFNNDEIFKILFLRNESVTIKWLAGLGMEADKQNRAFLS